MNKESFNNPWQVCTDDSCIHKSECAQHTTAGDFRTEFGHRPNINSDLDCLDYNDASVRYNSDGFINNLSEYVKQEKLKKELTVTELTKWLENHYVRLREFPSRNFTLSFIDKHGNESEVRGNSFLDCMEKANAKMDK